MLKKNKNTNKERRVIESKREREREGRINVKNRSEGVSWEKVRMWYLTTGERGER